MVRWLHSKLTSWTGPGTLCYRASPFCEIIPIDCRGISQAFPGV